MNLKKAIILVNLVITLMIVWVVGSIVYTWASNFGVKSYIELNDSKTRQQDVKLEVLKKDLKEFQSIIAKDIFNTLKDTSGSPVVNKGRGNAKETNLNLKLKGTAVGENNISYAIIFDGSTGKENLYELNETVQGARIQEILADKVILNKNGKEETLFLPVEKSGRNVQSSRTRQKRYRPPVRKYTPPKRRVRPPVAIQGKQRNIRPLKNKVKTPGIPNPDEVKY